MIDGTLGFFKQFNRGLWILAAGWFVGAMGFGASIPFIAIYFHDELGMSTIEIGLFFGAMAVVRSVFQAIGGEVSDRVGRVPLLVHSQFARSGAFFGLAMSVAYDMGFWWVAAFLLVNSIFGSIFMPAANAMVSDILPQEKRLDGYALTRTAGNLGWAAGPAIGGFLAAFSYAALFHLSAVITLLSGLIFWLFLKVPHTKRIAEQFRFSDLIAVRTDRNLAFHVFLIFCLYLVVSQLIAPFSVYTVEIVGISKSDLGLLFTLNGLLVALLQIPMTRLLSRTRFTTQLALGSFIYFIGFGIMGLFDSYNFLVAVVIVVTLGEIAMSPPSLTLTSRLAPEGRLGRYMGIHGFFAISGWSLGPLYGGFFLDRFVSSPALAWLMISSLALVSACGYVIFGRRLPSQYNRKEQSGK